MRAALALLPGLISGLIAAVASTARADDATGAAASGDAALGVGVAIGAGGQGGATYSAIDLGLDVAWRGARLGLGGRGVWLDGTWRTRDWRSAADAVRVIRLFEIAATPGGVQLALAGGSLAPAQLAHVADGHRAVLDDRPRTGARAGLASRRFAAGLEIDDVLEPSLIGGALAWQLAPPWGVSGATAIDPGISSESQPRSTTTLAAIEIAVARRWEHVRARTDVGAGIVGEPALGASAVAFAATTLERAGARWSARGELRGGTGTVGAAFGPLHRYERTRHLGEGGFGGALALGVAGTPGWIELGVRARPELGVLATASAGAPMGRWFQAGGWLAAARDTTAGAAELRVSWARRMSSTLELARMITVTDEMEPVVAWSASVWFGIASD